MAVAVAFAAHVDFPLKKSTLSMRHYLGVIRRTPISRNFKFTSVQEIKFIFSFLNIFEETFHPIQLLITKNLLFYILHGI